MATKEAIEDLFSWDGTLSSSDFYLAACAFAKKWKIYNPTVPQWLWLPCSKNDWVSSHMVDGYLSMENMFFLSSSEEEHVEGSKTRKEPESSEKEEPFDHATLVQSDFHEVHHYDFHIVYSASYRVPVLYFRAYHNDGQPLMFHEIEKDLPAQSAKILLESKWTFITQEEHPYLNKPWYKLHPCGTSEWMKLLFLSKASLSKTGLLVELYLVSWLSVVGQVVGLKIPSRMLISLDADYS